MSKSIQVLSPSTIEEGNQKKWMREVLLEAGFIIPPAIDIVPIEDAMKITNLARQTIYCKVSAGTIPYIKRPNSKKLMFSRKALIEWLKGEEDFK